MKTLFVFLIFLGFLVNSYAQNKPVTYRYWEQLPIYNPAYSGMLNSLDLSANYIDHFSPNNYSYRSFLFNGNYLFKEKHGLGVSYNFANWGNSPENNARLNYNYQISNNLRTKYSFGINAGVYNVQHGNHFIYPSGDTTLEYHSTTIGSTGAGFAISINNFNAGISLTNVSLFSSNELFSVKPMLHTYARYTKLITRKIGLLFKGQFLSQEGFQHLMLNVGAHYKNRYLIHLGYLSRNSYSTSIGWLFLENYHLGYTAAMTFSKLNNGSSSLTHEFNFRYSIPAKVPTTKIINNIDPNF